MKLILGAGQSSIAAVRESESDQETWAVGRIVFRGKWLESAYMKQERWCVLVSDDEVDDSELDYDHAVIAYYEIQDFDFAIECIRRDPEITLEDLKILGAI